MLRVAYTCRPSFAGSIDRFFEIFYPFLAEIVWRIKLHT